MTFGTRMSRTVPDLVCFSHLRWDFVFQRPQHLMTRFARERRVFFIEEPAGAEGDGRGRWWLDVRSTPSGVRVITPRHPAGYSGPPPANPARRVLEEYLRSESVGECVLWCYTPMALPLTRGLKTSAVVYDCMDELSAFRAAPPGLRRRERQLLRLADLVFTGGQSLFEAKHRLHPNVHPFPSSVDLQHFAQARTLPDDRPDQAAIPHPRLGFFGVIDERMDLELLRGLAQARPDWHLVLIGPVVKIDQAVLPRAANIHYLGSKTYEELPAYIAGWDVALIPFARNEATRYISPTKTPEYLAAGKPVVSTSITDVVRPYGVQGIVRIADAVPDFVRAVDAALNDPEGGRPAADAILSSMSWDTTWSRMRSLLDLAVAGRSALVGPSVNPVLAPEGASPAPHPSPWLASTT